MSLSRAQVSDNSVRRSSRFQSRLRRSNTSDIENGNVLFDEVSNSTSTLDVLCCIKPIGDTVGKFVCNKKMDTFLTMDNEGNIHYLRPFPFENDSRESQNEPKCLTIQDS